MSLAVAEGTHAHKHNEEETVLMSAMGASTLVIEREGADIREVLRTHWHSLRLPPGCNPSVVKELRKRTTCFGV